MLRALIALMLLPWLGSAAPPITHTGDLYNRGVPMTSAVSLTVAVYESLDDNVPVWVERHENVAHLVEVNTGTNPLDPVDFPPPSFEVSDPGLGTQPLTAVSPDGGYLPDPWARNQAPRRGW